LFSCLTNDAKLLCLNVFGRCSVSRRSGCQTVNVRPFALHEMMWSLDASETRFHVFLRARAGRPEGRVA